MDNEQTMDTGFDDFMSAFDGSTDYQTDAPEEKQTETETPDTEEPETEEKSTENTPEEAQTPGEEQKDQDTPAEAPAEQAEESFTLKINKQERTVSREEVISLAQKGADYDRVKDKLAAQTAALEEIAKDAGTDVNGLIRSLRVNMYKKQGLSEDAANERLLREDAERENARLKQEAAAPAESSSDRAKREVGEFRKHYPKVELTQELISKLTPDVQTGMTLTEAYRKYDLAQKEEKIAQLEKELAAEKKNKSNRAASPGSQKDSGGKRSKSDFDEFMEAFA